MLNGDFLYNEVVSTGFVVDVVARTGFVAADSAAVLLRRSSAETLLQLLLLLPHKAPAATAVVVPKVSTLEPAAQL